MYKLQSVDVNNNYFINYANSNINKVEKIKKSATQDKLMYIIFNENIDKKLYDVVALSLTLGDELRLPMHKKIVDILYFSLNVNFNKQRNVITNLTQGLFLFERFENNYSDVVMDDDNKRRFTTLKGIHPFVLKDFDVVWDIPVGFFKNNGKSFVTLGGLDYCFLSINDERIKIPRFLFIPFFKKSMIRGRVIGESTDYIKESFDLENKDAFEIVLEYCGYSKYATINGLNNYKVEFDKIFSTEENFEYDNMWEKTLREEMVFLPKIDYVPIKEGNKIIIFAKI